MSHVSLSGGFFVRASRHAVRSPADNRAMAVVVVVVVVVVVPQVPAPPRPAPPQRAPGGTLTHPAQLYSRDRYRSFIVVGRGDEVEAAFIIAALMDV